MLSQKLVLLVSMCIVVTMVGCVSVISGPQGSWVGMVNHIKPAVVFITIKATNVITEEEKNTFTGSGFVISEDGLIATAYHVVDELEKTYKPKVEIKFSNGKKYLAQWIYGNEEYDIAVLKINEINLPFLEFEDSPSQQGSPVLAMGSNDVSHWAVTDGIVSSLEANDGRGTKINFIQTTASLSPGYSGGPVVNNRGKVVGIMISWWTELNETYILSPGIKAKEIIQKLLKSNKKINL